MCPPEAITHLLITHWTHDLTEDSHMLSNSDKWVVEELDRRRAKQKSIDDNQKDKTADSARWPEQHSTLAEKCFLA